MSNIAGKAYGFTALTATRPSKTSFLRLSFVLIRLASRPLVQKLLHRVRLVATQKRLVDLSFIHFARWVIIPRRAFRSVAGQPRENLRHDYMLFCSNFNGGWEQYIQAFSSVIPGGMNLLWRWSPGFPGAEAITPFLAYIRECQIDTDYYYCAYPGASTNDIRAALHFASEFETFAADWEDRGPEEFEAAHNRFLGRVIRDLGSSGPAPWADDPLEPANVEQVA